LRKGALRASTFAMWGIPMVKNNDLKTDNLTVVRKKREPMKGPSGNGYGFLLSGNNIPPETWFTWWHDDALKLEVGKTYEMSWIVQINGQYTNWNIQSVHFEDERDKNKPERKKPDESKLGIDITAVVGQGESDEGDEWDISNLKPSDPEGLFESPTSGSGPSWQPNPQALGMCQNNVVELVAAGLIPLPDDVKGQKDKIFCFIKNLRDEMYEATAGQMFRSSHYCKAHKATRQMGKNGKWFHPLMEEHDETPAPDTELRVEGKRYCVQGQ